jgi:hypothetical protein
MYYVIVVGARGAGNTDRVGAPPALEAPTAMMHQTPRLKERQMADDTNSELTPGADGSANRRT